MSPVFFTTQTLPVGGLIIEVSLGPSTYPSDRRSNSATKVFRNPWRQAADRRTVRAPQSSLDRGARVRSRHHALRDAVADGRDVSTSAWRSLGVLKSSKAKNSPNKGSRFLSPGFGWLKFHRAVISSYSLVL